MTLLCAPALALPLNLTERQAEGRSFFAADLVLLPSAPPIT